MNLDEINSNFNIYDEVFSLSFKYNFIDMRYEFEIILADKLSEFIESKFLKLRLINVSDLCLDKLNGVYNQFSEIRIVRNSNGLDGVNYEIIQIEESNISCKFQSFSYELVDYIE